MAASQRPGLGGVLRGAQRPVITYIFRKRTPTEFSIEKLFETVVAGLERSGVPVRSLELPHVSTGLVSVLRNAWFVARQRNTGILHITGDVHYAALLRPFSKTVVTIHDCVVLQRGTGLKRWVMWMLWFWLPLRRASAITVISEQTERELLETVAISRGQIQVIPNFVDPNLTFSHRPFSAGRPRILHVGTRFNKNLARVIAALRGIPCVLVIVGPVPPPLWEEILANIDSYENLIAIDDAALAQQYVDADIISFPSTYEGFGMPILEGQAVGRAVLTSDLEPMRSVAGPGGALLVDPQSVAAIREGFLRLIREPGLRASLIAAGLANSSNFTLEKVLDSYRALYQRLEQR